jgi:hypothetical protein
LVRPVRRAFWTSLGTPLQLFYEEDLHLAVVREKEAEEPAEFNTIQFFSILTLRRALMLLSVRSSFGISCSLCSGIEEALLSATLFQYVFRSCIVFLWLR